MRKIIKNVILILLFLTLSVSTAYLAYLQFFSSAGEELSGEWTAELDMTKQAAATAALWLRDIEAVSVSLEDMENYMQDLTVQVNLILEPTAEKEGAFYCHVQPESYDACRQTAYEAFAAAFRDLLTQRLRMAGYTGSTEKEAVESLVTETFGMSTTSYLMSYGPELLPALEDLQIQYDGRGSYTAADGILTRWFDGGRPVATSVEHYIREESCLILSEDADTASPGSSLDWYPMIYILRQTQNADGQR